MPTPIVLSHFAVEPLLKARRAGESAARTTLDLGLTEVDVPLDGDGVTLPDGAQLAWPIVAEIAANEVACYAIEGGEAYKIQRFSEAMGRVYSLMPTRRAPTMLISGIPMHRIKDVDPTEDTRRKIRAAAPRGRTLDTATGLGYTAIAAAKRAETDSVITIEIDPTNDADDGSTYKYSTVKSTNWIDSQGYDEFIVGLARAAVLDVSVATGFIRLRTL